MQPAARRRSIVAAAVLHGWASLARGVVGARCRLQQGVQRVDGCCRSRQPPTLPPTAPRPPPQDLGWGDLRHMGNAAMLVLWGAKTESDQAKRDRMVCWAHGQIQYALGDGGAPRVAS